MLSALRSVRPPFRTVSIATSVREALDRSGYNHLRGLTVRETGRGCVRLEGQVPTYYMKVKAQSIAMSVPGVSQLENSVIVRREQNAFDSLGRPQSTLLASHLRRSDDQADERTLLQHTHRKDVIDEVEENAA